MGKKVDVDKLGDGRAALMTFWGTSNGGAEAWATCHVELAALGLSTKELELLRLRLPEATGTVGLRIATVHKMLEELALEAS